LTNGPHERNGSKPTEPAGIGGVRSVDPRVARLLSRLEAFLYQGGWPVRVARALGVRPTVRIVQHTVSLGAACADMPPLRVAYASDFHAGPTTDRTVLASACERLREASPDLLLLGGDFVTGRSEHIEWLAPEIGRIPARLGRFAVLGNHDRWSGAAPIVEALEGAGITVLLNANVRLPPPFDPVWVCGLDDHGTGWPDAAAAMRGADGTRIVLMHSPSGLLDLGGQRFEVAFCGHTHGGQLALPGGIAVMVPEGKLSRRYARGRFAVGESSTLLVSVGLGCVVLPLRTFADPEVLLCTLH